MPNKYVLVDAMNLAWRSHHIAKASVFNNNRKLKGLRSESGEATSVLYGILRTILDLQSAFPRHRIVFVWEGALYPGSEKTWRARLVTKTYKANRHHKAEDREEALGQARKIHELLKSIGRHSHYIDGLEADDVIGVLCGTLEADDVVIYSNDQDFYQLVRGHVRMYTRDWKKNTYKMLTEETLDVSPRLMATFKALVGDTSDNYKGVPGVGPKKAKELIAAGLRMGPKVEHYLDLPKSARKVFSPFKQHFEELKKCYLLAKIPRKPTFQFFNETQVEELFRLALRVQRNKPPKLSESQRREALRKFCHRYDLASFLPHLGELITAL